MAFFIYKTTNLLNGKYYIGSHVNNSDEKSEICRLAGKNSQANLSETEKARRFQLLTEARLKITGEQKSKMHQNNRAFSGRKHSQETLARMSETKRLMYNSNNNPSLGCCWITKDKENKLIPKESLNEWESLGWKKGRILKDKI